MKTKPTPPLLIKTNSSIKHLIINRPEQRNALNLETITLLTQQFLKLADDKTTRCILLSGAGPEAFSAGADLKELALRNSPAERREFFRALAKLLDTIYTCPKPVVAKVQGFALAGGCGLAAAADITLASETACFGLPEIHRGLVPMAIMRPLSRLIPKKVLAELVFLGETINAQRALEIGLITRIVPKDQLDQTALAICQKLAQIDPLASSLAKEALIQVDELGLRNALPIFAERSAYLSVLTHTGGNKATTRSVKK